eukprot:CAMPEP_0113959938 /NCGR_PEP_ID=MMETSP0011_2-20120614/4431_1 /TAXON_ID=101924 /ORGANISM="Rhodosorus marinus" /LENGTH=1036 /DNA_ID=CAMNT_0000971323 /DNA_START=446 /DNA_END=3556 /DNA_ORIENTATION=- /assembly_acc=CAM_ASM_000156
MKLCRPPGDDQDQLLVLTERYKFFVLKWNANTNRCETLAGGDVKDKIGRMDNHNIIGIADPQLRCFGLYLYERLLKIIPTDYSREAYNIRIGDNVHEIVFLYGCATPTIACLHGRDSGYLRALEIHQDVNPVEASQEVWQIEIKASFGTRIVAVPEPLCGVLVIGEDTITYVANPPRGEPLSVRIPSSLSKQTVGRVDQDGSRYLLGDDTGALRLLVLEKHENKVSGLKIEELGTTSISSAISYLDNGFVFIGSRFGDSQLIELLKEMDPESKMNLRVMATYPNIGPIKDFILVEDEKQSRKVVVTCSGLSLRVIRNGTSVVEQASVQIAGITGMFSLKRKAKDPFYSYLIQSFTTETRILEMTSATEMQEAVIAGLNHSAPTLFAANTVGDTIVQVTGDGIILLSSETMTATSEWKPPNTCRITVASGNVEQLLVATSDGSLISFEIDPASKSIVEKGHVQLENEVSCLDCTPLGDESRAKWAAVGTWKDVNVQLVSLPELKTVLVENLGGNLIARSLLFTTLDEKTFMLLVADGDGYVVSYLLNPNGRADDILSEKRRINVGTQPATLVPFRNQNRMFVFAACDRPTVLYTAFRSHKLLCSNINLREVTHVCMFDSEAFPECLAIATESSLIIGGVDDVQGFHVRTIPFDEQPRRITRVPKARLFAVLFEKQDGLRERKESGSPKTEMDGVVLLNNDFQVLHRFNFQENETGCSLLATTFGNNDEDAQEHVVVATAYNTEGSANSETGRILVFTIAEARLLLVSETEMKGFVFCVEQFMGGVVAGVSGRVILLKWEDGENNTKKLVPRSSRHGQILVLALDCVDKWILSGDMIKSMRLLTFDEQQNTLEETARDYETNWMTEVAMVDNKNFIGTDGSFNMFTLQWNPDALYKEDRTRLEKVGEFHLGESVNRIRRGHLSPQVDSDGPVLHSHIFATVSGVLGVAAQLKPDAWNFFSKVQDAMRQVVTGVGGIKHKEWRSFSNERRTGEAKKFVDGDLIERFLDLDQVSMEKVALIVEVPVEDLAMRIQDMSRFY